MITTGTAFGAGEHSPAKWLLDCSTRALQGVARWHAARRTAAELAALDDHILKDIGVDRTEITSLAAHGGFDASRRGR